MAQFKVKFKLIATSKPTLAPRLPVHSAVSHVGFMMVCRMDIAYMNTGISSAWNNKWRDINHLEGHNSLYCITDGYIQDIYVSYETSEKRTRK